MTTEKLIAQKFLTVVEETNRAMINERQPDSDFRKMFMKYLERNKNDLVIVYL